MSEQGIAARVVTALSRQADEAAGDATQLVSVTIDMILSAPFTEVETQIVRKTRTLVFVRAEVRAANGDQIAVASSVHKLAT